MSASSSAAALQAVEHGTGRAVGAIQKLLLWRTHPSKLIVRLGVGTSPQPTSHLGDVLQPLWTAQTTGEMIFLNSLPHPLETASSHVARRVGVKRGTGGAAGVI